MRLYALPAFPVAGICFMLLPLFLLVQGGFSKLATNLFVENSLIIYIFKNINEDWVDSDNKKGVVWFSTLTLLSVIWLFCGFRHIYLRMNTIGRDQNNEDAKDDLWFSWVYGILYGLINVLLFPYGKTVIIGDDIIAWWLLLALVFNIVFGWLLYFGITN